MRTPARGWARFRETWLFRADRALLKLMLLVGMVVGFFIFHIWVRTLSLTEGYEVDMARREVAKLESELARARLEHNRLLGPDNLQGLVRDFEAQGVAFQPPQAAQLIYTKSRQ